MISHLQLGRVEGSRILKAETARKMHSTSFRQDGLQSSGNAALKGTPMDSREAGSISPGQAQWLGGIAHGFLEQPYGRLRCIGHGGDTFLFHSEMRLVPSHNLGVFVTYNSPDGAVARDQVIRAFLDRYFASYADWPDKSAGEGSGARGGAGAGARPIGNLGEYAGVYGSTRVSRTTVDRLLELMTVATVRPDPTDETGTSLLVTLSPDRGAQRFKEVERGAFQEVDGPGRIAFVTGIKGRPGRLLMGAAWMSEKMSWYQTPGVQVGIAVACLLVFLSAVIVWPIGSVHGWRRQRLLRSGLRSTGSLNGQRLVRWLAGIVSALFLVVLAFLLIALQDPMKIAFGVPAGLRVGLGLALVTALLSPVVALAAVAAWRSRHFTLAGRVHFTLAATASVVFAIWLNHWNLLGFRF